MRSATRDAEPDSGAAPHTVARAPPEALVRGEASVALHPLLTKEYAIYTPTIAQFGTSIQRWAADRLPGGLITGYARTGKTTAVLHWAATLLRETEGPTLPVLTLSALDRSTSPNLFWAHFLRSTGLAPWKSGDRLIRFDRAVAGLCRRALENPSRYLVLIIDEANNLNALHWQQLKDLQNELDANATRLTVISVGTHELGEARSTLTLAGDSHLTARFMVQQCAFRGLVDVDELRFVLEGYDQHSRWPAPDGPTYTEYFAPRDYAAGFRLADYTCAIWQAMARRLPAMRGDALIEIPMAFVGMLAEHVLRNAARCELRALLTPRALDEALCQRNFSEHMEITQRLQREGR
ncbi:conserved hypothetical protein [Cupriavidus necator]|uniref:ORC1/DEAH AAA+ ATPase domain-containing protein n=1 Tax=Cupriavidus necator TaxID=106590 RepID=A0A1K0JDU1_CUPNE|nr:conserved hypothetical protein [Cupriavidus necator]